MTTRRTAQHVCAGSWRRGIGENSRRRYQTHPSAPAWRSPPLLAGFFGVGFFRRAPPGLSGIAVWSGPPYLRVLPAVLPRPPSAPSSPGALLRSPGLRCGLFLPGCWPPGLRPISGSFAPPTPGRIRIPPRLRASTLSPGVLSPGRRSAAVRGSTPRGPLRLPGAPRCPRWGPRTACSNIAGLAWSASPCSFRMTHSARFRLRRTAHRAAASLVPPFRGRAASGLPAGSRPFGVSPDRPAGLRPCGGGSCAAVFSFLVVGSPTVAPPPPRLFRPASSAPRLTVLRRRGRYRSWRRLSRPAARPNRPVRGSSPRSPVLAVCAPLLRRGAP